jgi:hypothetical protein
MKNGIVVSDQKYHNKQKNPEQSAIEEIRSIWQSHKDEIEQETTHMVNQMGDLKELYFKLRDTKDKYTANFDKFSDGMTVDKYAIDRDPLLSKFQKQFEAQMMQNCSDANGAGFMKNSYSGYGASAHFMIRALSYIYPMLIIKPLPKLTWREDWPVFTSSAWAAFDVFLTAARIYNATDNVEGANDSGRAAAQFGESIFQNVTIRQDLVWDSTVEMYADASMNNSLIQYTYMESLKRGFDEKVNSIYLFGDPDYGINGLLTNSNITRIPSVGPWNLSNANGEKNSTLDLIALTQQVEQQSLGVYSAKKVMMSLLLKPLVVQPRSQYVSTSPIGYVAGQAWGVDFEKVLQVARYNPYLNNQGTAISGSATQLCVAYDVDTSFAHIGVPVFMFAEPLSYENHKFKMPFLTRTGGFRVVQSPSLAILDYVQTTTNYPIP